MSYDYAEERPKLFTENGVEVLTAVRRNVARALAAGGAVQAGFAISGVGGDSWVQLAALDYLVEKGELREITEQGKVWGQHRVFVKGGRS
jgi:hypothetical protein